MALGIHDACANRLEEALRKILKDAVVECGVLLSRTSESDFGCLDDILPKKAKERDLLERYIGEEPASHFFRSEISSRLLRGSFDSQAEDRLLANVPDFSEPESVAHDLVSSLRSLPWTYSFCFPLSAPLSASLIQHGQEINIASRMALVVPDERLLEKFPEPLPRAQLSRPGIRKPAGWDLRTAYLKIEADGYLGKSFPSETAAEAVARFKAFLGMGLAFGAVRLPYGTPQPSENRDVYVHRLIDGIWEYHGALQLEKSLSDALNSLTTSFGSGRHIAHWVDQLVHFGETFDHERSRSLHLAAQWFFDSKIDRDSLLAFVKAAVVCEILLGDTSDSSEAVGLTELLANRCAYLISKSFSEREELIKQFRQIYRVRSKIVHQGKSRLSLEDRELLGLLRSICSRVIKAEARLLLRA